MGHRGDARVKFLTVVFVAARQGRDDVQSFPISVSVSMRLLVPVRGSLTRFETHQWDVTRRLIYCRQRESAAETLVVEPVCRLKSVTLECENYRLLALSRLSALVYFVESSLQIGMRLTGCQAPHEVSGLAADFLRKTGDASQEVHQTEDEEVTEIRVGGQVTEVRYALTQVPRKSIET